MITKVAILYLQLKDPAQPRCVGCVCGVYLWCVWGVFVVCVGVWGVWVWVFGGVRCVCRGVCGGACVGVFVGCVGVGVWGCGVWVGVSLMTSLPSTELGQ